MIHNTQISTLAENLNNSSCFEDDLCSKILFKDKLAKGLIRSGESQQCYGIRFVQRLLEASFQENIKISSLKLDGDQCGEGEALLRIEASVDQLLSLIKGSLFFISRITALVKNIQAYKKLLENSASKLSPGRYHTPFLKTLEKEAYTLAKLFSHKRFFTKTIVLQKEHISLSPSLASLLSDLTENLPPTTRIEVHASDLEEVKEASEFGVDLIVLKGFSFDELRMAQRINNARSYLEVTGDLSFDEVRSLTSLGLNFISTDLFIKTPESAPFKFEVSSL